MQMHSRKSRTFLQRAYRETMGPTETLHPQNTRKNSEAFSKGSLSDICCWKAAWAVPLCWSKGDALQPLRKGIFVIWRSCTSRNTSRDQSNWHVLEIGIRTQNNNNKSPAAVSTSYVWIVQVINNILLLPLCQNSRFCPWWLNVIASYLLAAGTGPPDTHFMHSCLAFACPEEHMLTGKMDNYIIMSCPADQIFPPYSSHK